MVIAVRGRPPDREQELERGSRWRRGDLIGELVDPLVNKASNAAVMRRRVVCGEAT